MVGAQKSVFLKNTKRETTANYYIRQNVKYYERQSRGCDSSKKRGQLFLKLKYS